MDLVIFLMSAAHLVYTPFTKVEESFNLQAMHDILYLRHNISQYDHHDYPGVVPRTFLGPLFISILSTPFVLLFETLHINKFWTQYVVRLMLAGVVSVAWYRLSDVILKIYHLELLMWFNYIIYTQFHFIFYMSRTLPNIMALPIVLFAVTYWLKGQMKPFIICSGIAILVFRSELIIFLGLLLLFSILQKKITIDRVLKIALPAGLVILATTIIVDSFFWQRFVWPEGEVLWYNTILNKSANWGTSPFLWYFYSALPRAMGLTIFFVPVGYYYEPRVRPLVLAVLGFVLIYSLLPHKELRFIIYVIPLLNLSAACGCCRLWINSAKSKWNTFFAFCAGGHLLVNIFISLFLLVVSGTNYPGGVALSRLHRLEVNTTNVSVHISNLAAQSGVSRFMQIRDDWRYCKNESITYTPEEILRYTHLLVEAKNKHNTQLWATLQENFETLEYVDCFNSIGIQYNSLLPVRIKTKACLAILKKRNQTQTVTDIPKDKKSKEKTDAVEDKAKIKTASSKKTKTEKLSKRSADEISKDTANLNESVVPIVEGKENAYEDHISDDNYVVQDNAVKNKDDACEDDNVQAAKDEVPSHDIEPDTIEEAFISSVEQDDTIAPSKDINFQELRNLALGEITKKTKATKQKIRKIIEQHYRSKGKQIESDSLEKADKHTYSSGTKPTVKSIIKQERIKEIIEQIAVMDLTKLCDLERVSTKDCLKHVIDKIDDDGSRT